MKQKIHIYIHTTVFKNVAHLKTCIKYINLLLPYQKETLSDKRTKDTQI